MERHGFARQYMGNTHEHENASQFEQAQRLKKEAESARRRADAEFSAAQGARQAYKASIGTSEGLPLETVVEETVEELFEFSKPKMKKNPATGEKKLEAPSEEHNALSKIKDWFARFRSVGGQSLAEIIAQRIRQRLLQRQKLVKDNAKMREFERMEAERGDAKLGLGMGL